MYLVYCIYIYLVFTFIINIIIKLIRRSDKRNQASRSHRRRGSGAHPLNMYIVQIIRAHMCEFIIHNCVRVCVERTAIFFSFSFTTHISPTRPPLNPVDAPPRTNEKKKHQKDCFCAVKHCEICRSVNNEYILHTKFMDRIHGDDES